MSNDVLPAVGSTTSPLAVVQTDPMTILLAAVQQGGVDIAVIERIEAMAERAAARQREAAFNAAFAEFKAECPVVVRRTEDGNPQMRVTRNGISRQRRYASIEDVDATVRPVLSRHGLSCSWTRPEVSDRGLLTLAFVLRHAMGHSVETSSPPIPVEGTESFGTERKSSSCSPQQRYGVATTYAMRYSMIAGLGLTTCDDDTDGAPYGDAANEATITDDQEHRLLDLISSVGADKAKFLKFLGVESVGKIPSRRYDEAINALQRKAQQ